MDLSKYRCKSGLAGASFLKQMFWYFLGAPLVKCYWSPLSGLKVFLLRVFGAKIGNQVCIKPGVKVKFPWKLEVGDHSWIGEDVWIDNLAPVTIGKNVCISQGAFLCTGSHDWNDSGFGLITKPIIIEDGVWIAAKAIVGPGVTVRQGAVLTLGSVATKDLETMKIYSGHPAQAVNDRKEQ